MTDSVAKLRKGSSNSKEKLRNGAKDETSESNASCSDMVEEYSTQWPDRPYVKFFMFIMHTRLQVQS